MQRRIIFIIIICLTTIMFSSCKVQYDTAERIDEGAPASVETQITLANWQEFFELKEAARWDENAFGEAETLRVVYYLVLRDEYKDRIDKSNEAAIAFEFEYDRILTDITVDHEKREYSYTDTVYEDSQGHENSSLAIYSWMLADSGFFEICSCAEGYYIIDGTMVPNCYRFFNVDVTQAEGSIRLLEDD